MPRANTGERAASPVAFTMLGSQQLLHILLATPNHSPELVLGAESIAALPEIKRFLKPAIVGRVFGRHWID